jgi:hypothetical protein
MSTRAQIAIQTGPDNWAHVYVHFDGYPSHMLNVLAHWTPADIHAAKEIRQACGRAGVFRSTARAPHPATAHLRTLPSLYLAGRCMA